MDKDLNKFGIIHDFTVLTSIVNRRVGEAKNSIHIARQILDDADVPIETIKKLLDEAYATLQTLST